MLGKRAELLDDREICTSRNFKKNEAENNTYVR